MMYEFRVKVFIIEDLKDYRIQSHNCFVLMSFCLILCRYSVSVPALCKRLAVWIYYITTDK